MKIKTICILSLTCILLAAFPITAFAASKAAKTYDKAQDALVDGEYKKAVELFESISTYEDAAQCALYAKSLWYGSENKYDDALKTLAFLGDFKDSAQLTNYYSICKLSTSTRLSDLFDAAEQFDAISAYRDSAVRADQCRQRLYIEGEYRLSVKDYDIARWIFGELKGYKDSAERIDDVKAAENGDAYIQAEGLLEQGKYDEAEILFRDLGDFRDSQNRVLEIVEIKNSTAYSQAEALLASGNYDEAVKAFKALADYKDSAQRVEEVYETQKAEAYSKAEALLTAGDYDAAYFAFSQLRGYKDVNDLLKTDERLIAVWRKKCETVGNIVTFGTYEQDNNTSNGKEEIEWIVLANEGNQSLLISRYLLDYQPYNTEYEKVTWETCTLRTWLHSTFLNTAFSSAEQKAILNTSVDNSVSQGNSEWSTSDDTTTTDQIFLLSYAEAEEYFTTFRTRKCECTQYVKALEAYTNDGGNCSWWLRSPGGSKIGGSAAYVASNGALGSYYDVSLTGIAVRPVFWINLESVIF